ncbi:translation initiation factor IF-2-like [Pollicipes pollicipes]|uniref:translation initiation factor IF-2-like n=1 Tax=Pollicipes pollicipes TaxID=41117 RepID=UPI0018853FDB|nr:translation initiation factor IF-2-like [Pollicipes pollicipes]
MPSRLRSRRRPAPDESSDDEVTFKRSTDPGVCSDDSVSTVADEARPAADSGDEAPETVGLAGSRQEAERLLADLAASRRRRDEARRQRDTAHQQRNREQKLDKQRRLELELSQEILDDLAADEDAPEDEADASAAPPRRAGRAGVGSLRPKKKRFRYPTPATPAGPDFIALADGEATEFRAAGAAGRGAAGRGEPAAGRPAGAAAVRRQDPTHLGAGTAPAAAQADRLREVRAPVRP